MNYRQTIIDSWKFTQENKRLIYWFGFLPSFLTTTVGIGYIAYQFFAFKKSYLFNETDESFLNDVVGFVWNFLKTHASLSVPLIIVAIIIAVLWFLVPTLFKASAIQAIARAKNGQKSGVGVGLKYGMLVFLPLFEFHLLVKTFAPFSIIIEMGFVLRNLGPAIFQMMIPAFVLIFVVSIALFLLFTYSDLFIIVDDEGILSAMKKSAKLVIFNWQQTFLITFLMIIIGVRIVIQAILVFLIPAIVLLTGAFLATLALESALLVVAGAVGVVALVVAAYLGGIVDIFSYAVWTFTFLELTSQKEVSARESARVLPKVERAQDGMQNGMQAGVQNGMQAGAQNGMQAGMQNGMQAGVQNGMQAGNVSVGSAPVGSGATVSALAVSAPTESMPTVSTLAESTSVERVSSETSPEPDTSPFVS